jgi:hypothetical protein
MYLNQRAETVQIEDPRPGELPAGWKEKSHDREYAWHWYVKVNEPS